MSLARSTALWLAVLVAVSAGTSARAQVSEAQLGPAPRVTDLRQFEAARPESGVVQPALAVDPHDRSAVINLYRNTFLPALAVPNDWTGNVAGCVAGHTSAAYAQATVDAVNYFRAMVQLPSVVENTGKSALAQQAALMMSANNALDHTPPTTWRCYSAEGAEAAGHSNLALGMSGARAIRGYLEDFGTGNTAVGHRRWILYPRQVEMGTGSTSNANSLWVIGDVGARPSTPEFVAWPPAGYVPFPLVFPRWSFSVNGGSSVNFSGAVVSLTRGGMPVTLTMLPLANGYGDNTIVWEPAGLTFREGMADQDISVEVQNVVVAGVARSYRYTVTVVDPVATGSVLCTFTVAPQAIAALAPAANATIQVTASHPTCAWAAVVTSGASWLGITGQAGGTGSGTLSFRIDANPGPARTGRLSVAGQVVDVSQHASTPAAPPVYYYLAEGATSIFELDIAVANPNAVPAPVQLRFLLPDGRVKVHADALPATSRRTYRAGALPGLDLDDVQGVSTVVESTNGLPLLVERTMAWDKANGYGAHGGTAVGEPATRWYFGEGSQGFFDTYLLLANSGASPAHVVITFLREGGAPVTVERVVGATSRVTLWAGEVPEIAALPGTAFSMVVSSDVPILAERAMYFGVAPFWSGGHESAGVPALATTWFHAEGATGPYFDEYLLVGNPGDQDAGVTFTFLLEGGRTIVGRKQVPAASRFTLNVENADSSLDIVSGDASLLKNAAVSTKVESTVPIVSERAMYWPHTFTEWFEAHDSLGVTETATRWGLAEGRVGGDRGHETYILLANPTAQDARVRVTYLRSDGSIIVRNLTVGANSRLNEYANSVSGLSNEEFGVVLESTNGVPIAVERAMYWNAPGQPWAAGTNAVATKLP